MRDSFYDVDIDRAMYRVANFKQYDNGINYTIRLIKNNAPIDLSGYVVSAFFTNKNGVVYERNTTVSGSSVKVVLDHDVLGVAGDVVVEFVLFKEGKRVTTFDIHLKVFPSSNKDEIMQALPQWEALDSVLDMVALKGELEELERTLEANEEDRVSTFASWQGIIGNVSSEIDNIKDDFNNHIVNHPTGDSHTHTNKTVLDGIDTTKVTEWNSKATTNYVDTKIAEAQLGGGEADLSGYATKDELNTKVDKIVGKGLSTNDYTSAEKTKLAGLSNYTHPNDTNTRHVTDAEKTTWNAKSNFSGSYSDLTNKPTIPTVENVLTSTSTTNALSANQGKVLKDEIENLKLSVSNGKVLIATAITDMGVPASGSDTFLQLSNKIRDINGDVVIPPSEEGTLGNDYRAVAFVLKPWENALTCLDGLDMFTKYKYNSALICLPVDCSFSNNSPFCDVTETMINTVCNKVESLGLKPILKLHTVSLESDGQGNIDTPNNATTWFNNYRNLVNHYANIVVKRGYKEFIISNEMHNVMNVSNWKSLFTPTISDVKAKGLKVSMSMNTPEVVGNDGFQYFDELDFYCMNTYPQLTTNSIEWARENHEKLKEGFYNSLSGIDIAYNDLFINMGGVDNAHKKIWLTEVGCIPRQRGLEYPAFWGDDTSNPYNEEPQKLWLDAVFDVLENDRISDKLSNRVDMYMLWDGNSDSDFNPIGNMAESILDKYWLNDYKGDIEDGNTDAPQPPVEQKITITSWSYNAKVSDTTVEIMGTSNLTGVNNYEALADNDVWAGVATYSNGVFLLDISWISWEDDMKNLRMIAKDYNGNIISRSDETFNLKITNQEVPQNVPVTSVNISKVSHTFTNTDALQLSATILPSNATNKDIVWSTSNISIATVSPNGLVRPVNNGSCAIEVKTVDGNFKKTCNITVDIDETNGEPINYFDINNTSVETYRSSYVVDKANNKVTVTSVNEGGIDGYIKWSLPKLQEGRTYRITCKANETRNFTRIRVNGSAIVTKDQATSYDYTFVGVDGETNLVDLEIGIRYRNDTSTTPINIAFTDIKIIDVDGDPDIPEVEGGLTFTVEDYKIIITDGTNTETYDACCDIPTGDYVKGYKTVIKNRVAYHLPLSNSGSSVFSINGLKPINHGYIDATFKAKFSHRAYAYVQNTLTFPLRNDPIKPVNEEALMEAIRIFNCAMPGKMKIIIDPTSENTVSEDYFVEEFFGICRLHQGEKFKVDMNTRFLGVQSNNPQFVGVLVHEFGHITGIWDDSPHFPSMYNYDRDWSKTLYLQPSDIMHIKDKYSHLLI